MTQPITTSLPSESTKQVSILSNQAGHGGGKDSPDTLPQRGYSFDQLKDYIFRQLGAPTWNIELTPQQCYDTIQDALLTYSIWRPLHKFGTFRLTKGIFQYLDGQDMGLGVTYVQFVEPNPVPTELFYGNLIDPAPLFRSGLDEYDTFLRWRKTWQRVTSVQPDWLYDDSRRILYIHNPIERYQAGLEWNIPYSDTTALDYTGADWVKKYALAKSRFLYAEVLNKFSGAIPGPLKDLQLDGQQKRTEAQTQIDTLMENLKAMQDLTPISGD